MINIPNLLKNKLTVYVFLLTFFHLFIQSAYTSSSFSHLPDEIKAIYLSRDNLRNEAKIKELEKILETTSANGIVIDFKDNNVPDIPYLKYLAARFKKYNTYLIARIVVLQDSYFARRHPHTAIKTSSGDFWSSGRKVWKRYWLDPASPEVLAYTIETAKKAIDSGFDEIQFDYLRFPTDGNMHDIVYPAFNKRMQTKQSVMRSFFKGLRQELKSYSSQIILSIDVFGEVFVYGKEPGIGQYLLDIAKYFDVLSPMAYPSHYHCGSFNLKDPTANPYRVYYDTLQKGKRILGEKNIIIRPWIQDFTMHSIYECGPTVVYTKEKVYLQIKAGYDNGINGFMLWNVRNKFTKEVFE